jgi:hypothetical protein
MRGRTLITFLLLGTTITFATGSGSAEPQFTSDFGLETCGVLLPTGGNQYMSIDPGRTLILAGESDGERVVKRIAALNRTKPIIFEAAGYAKLAIARVVEEREWIDGELAEVSRSFLATCPDTGNVFQFGEEVDEYEDGEVVGHEGSWIVGEDGAKPGLVMPATFLLGSRYQHGNAPGVAEDRVEHVSMGMKVETPAGTFTACISVMETSPLEPDDGDDLVIYAPGVGPIVDGALELVKYE